ncbi:aminotransferase class I and II protein [Ceratobasidium sp. AG-Ba]|nr:aminotransferase class I and II protein [Ceratobasidium sp. AG-Ba]
MILPSTNITAEDASEVSQLELTQSPKYARHDYARFLARSAALRNIEGIRGLLQYELQPGLISLLAGKPNPTTFPIEEISLTLRSPTGPQPYQSSASESAVVRETLTIKDGDIAKALQYTPTEGIPELRKLLSEYQKTEHGVNIDNIELQLMMGSGSQDLLYKAFSSLLDPGDSMLVEAPVYAGALAILEPLEADIVEIQTDPSGLSISHLRSTLESWPVGKRLPKLIYTTPFGCNPTGATTAFERRKALLELAEEYDFLILEDDPYYYLYFGSNERPPSYLSLENTLIENAEVGKRQRRVMRFDSFSKVLSSGMRVGFLTGPPALLEPISSHTSAANLHSSTTTQSMVLAILKHWGRSGFHAHVSNICDFYRAKRDVFHEAMTKHFGNGLAEWTKPEAGLFFWFKLNLPPSKSDSYHLIRTKALAKGVLAVPGAAFYPSGRKSAYVRASFSLVDKQDADEALRRLAEVVKEAITVDKGEGE